MLRRISWVLIAVSLAAFWAIAVGFLVSHPLLAVAVLITSLCAFLGVIHITPAPVVETETGL